MKEADRIKFILLRDLITKSSGYVVANYYFGNWECDVLVFSQNGYTTEYEIKISKSDFMVDFKKGNRRNGYLLPDRYFKNKHNEIKEGKRTNKFCFVFPTALYETIDKSLIPDYAGVITIGDRWFDINIMRNPRFLHKNKCIDKSQLIDRLYHRYIHKVFYPEFRKAKL